MFIKTGNIAKPEKINDLNQLYVRFQITTETALEWLYKWIHENLLDGSVNHYRDQEIQYITGSNEFPIPSSIILNPCSNVIASR